MPLYFFDFHGSDSDTIDDQGCHFDDLEAAYLDAYRTMVRIGAEQILEHHDPSEQWIDIRDETDVILTTVAFDEVFRRRPLRPVGRINPHVELGRQLRQDIREACAEARASILTARKTLDRVGTLWPERLATSPPGS